MTEMPQNHTQSPPLEARDQTYKRVVWVCVSVQASGYMLQVEAPNLLGKLSSVL